MTMFDEDELDDLLRGPQETVGGRGGFRPRSPLDAKNSGQVIVARQTSGTLFKATLMRCRPSPGDEGMACLLFDVEERNPEAATGNEDWMLQAVLTWRTGPRAGGSAVVDITAGAPVGLTGRDSVDVDLQVVPATSGGTILMLSDLIVEGGVVWGGSLNPKTPMVASPRMSLVSNTLSAWVETPKYSQELMVLTDTPASAGAITVEYARSDPGGAFVGAPATLAGRSINPTAQSMPVVAGARRVRFLSSGVNQVVTPVWGLSL